MRSFIVLTLLATLALAEDPPKPEPGPGDTRPVEKAVDDMGDLLRTRPERKLAIAWVMDDSGSMADDRKMVLQRLDELMKKLGDKETAMAVLSFSKKCRVICPLTTDLAKVKAAIRDLAEGKGEENCMEAVREAVKVIPMPSTYRVVILMTDEKGDDAKDLDATIAAAKKVQAHVFLLGREAPFGWFHGYEKDEKLGFNVTVDAGPESASQETAQMNPICCQQQDWCYCRKMLLEPARRWEESYFQDKNPLGCDLAFDEQVLSGYAPWAESRLAAETGGQVWLIRGKGEWDPKAMKGYEPDLCSLADYQKKNASDPLRKAVVGVLQEFEAGKAWRLENNHLKQGMSDHLAKRAQELEAQARKWIVRLKAAKPNLPSTGEAMPKRWVAHRDLLTAQLYVLLYWLEQYTLCLAQAEWPKEAEIALTKGKARGSGEAKVEAVRALEQVEHDHPGTPWAETAERLAASLAGFDLVGFQYGGGGGGRGPSQGSK